MASSPGLNLRKHADQASGERVVRYDPVTGARNLVNPATPGDDHEPWPLAGVEILDDPLPETIRLSTGIVAQGRHEGWIDVEGEEVVHRPGGPPEDPWRLTHSLAHLDAIVIHTVDGDVRYEVTRQPDKYVVAERDDSGKYPVEVADDNAEVTPEIYSAGDTTVDKFYDLKLVK